MVRNRTASGWYFLDSLRYELRISRRDAVRSILRVWYGLMICLSAVRKSSMRKFFSGFVAWMRVLDVAVAVAVDDLDVDLDLDCGMKDCTTIGRRSRKIHDLMMAVVFFVLFYPFFF